MNNTETLPRQADTSSSPVINLSETRKRLDKAVCVAAIRDLRSHRSARIRQGAVTTLCNRNWLPAIHDVAHALQNDPSSEVRTQAASCLSHFSDLGGYAYFSIILDYLLDGLKDSCEEVVEVSARVLARMRPPQAQVVEAIEEALAKYPHLSGVREELEKAAEAIWSQIEDNVWMDEIAWGW